MTSILHVGDRVVVRYRLGAHTPADWRPGATAATHSDVTGLLVDDGDPLVLDRGGVRESIPRAAVTSVRLLSAGPVRNSEIRELELAAAHAWPGLESTWIDGWLARAGAGHTRAANSAIPIDRTAQAGPTIALIVDWYAQRSLPPLLSLPERLLGAGSVEGTAGPEIQFLTARVRDLSLADTADTSPVLLGEAPGAPWVRSYLDSQPNPPDPQLAAQLLAAATGSVAFAHTGTRTDDDAPAAIGRAALSAASTAAPWLGLTTVWTAPGHRRCGLATAVLSRLLAWGRDQGADDVFVALETSDPIAGAWFRRLGFGLHHTARYLSPPSTGERA